MAALYIKDFPDEVLEKLDSEADSQRRSRPAQLIWILEERYGLGKAEKANEEAAA